MERSIEEQKMRDLDSAYQQARPKLAGKPNTQSALQGTGKKFVVYCPNCQTGLAVNEGATAYVCPACNNIFKVRTHSRKVKELLDESVETEN